MKSQTPVFLVEEIEPCLEFWTRLGFEKTVEVPHEGKLGFVALQNGPVEIMLQSRASALADVPALATGPLAKDGVGLFVRVESLDAVLPKLEGVEVTVPERTTFYGAREYGVRAPGGIQVLFAEFVEQAEPPKNP